MRDHLSLRQLGEALGVRRRYAGGATDLALHKVVLIFLMFPKEYGALFMDRVNRYRQFELENGRLPTRDEIALVVSYGPSAETPRRMAA